MQFTAKQLPYALVAGPLLVTACADQPQLGDLRGSCESCNVILISLDTLRADHLGAYDYERSTSPHLDAIAHRGVLFERCYAQAPGTLLSHMSIITGLYPRRHGVVNTHLILSDQTPTMASLLRQRGYSTAAFTGGGYVRERFGYHGFDRFQELQDGASYRRENQRFSEMLDWLDSQAGPFFLFWHSYRVHSPYHPPPEYDHFSDPSYDGIVVVDPGRPVEFCEGVQHPGCQRKGLPYFQRILDQMSSRDVQHVVDKYDGELVSLDALVGTLWEYLEAAGLLENTIVVIISDHGESFAERERNIRIGHGLPYREVLHVPLIVYTPGIEGGRRRGEIVQAIDVMPTIFDLLGEDVPSDLEGRTLLHDEPSEYRRFAFAEAWDSGGLTALSLIYSHYHFIDWTGQPDELFDLQVDPGEQRNLIEGESALAQRLRQIVTQVGVRSPAASLQQEELDEETARQLGALGYL